MCVGWNSSYLDYKVIVYKVKGNRLERKWKDRESGIIYNEVLEGPIGLNGEYKIIESSSLFGNYTGRVLIENTIKFII